MTASSANAEETPTRKRQCQAVVAYRTPIRNRSAAAKSSRFDTVISALEDLLHVTTVALEEYQDRVKQGLWIPIKSAGGMLDGSIIRGGMYKGGFWSSVFFPQST